MVLNTVEQENQIYGMDLSSNSRNHGMGLADGS